MRDGARWRIGVIVGLVAASLLGVAGAQGGSLVSAFSVVRLGDHESGAWIRTSRAIPVLGVLHERAVLVQLVDRSRRARLRTR